MDYLICQIVPEDWLQVRAIYLEGILTGMATFETEAPSWEHWDATHLIDPRLVARVGSQVLGWAALSPVSSRAVYAGVAEISIYISEQRRGQKIGTSLMDALVKRSEEVGIWTLQASIFPENLSSLGLQQKFGFRVVGRRERIGQVNGNWRDTILLERRCRL
jgi:L-amino acid N-acyltransferase YncA